MGMNGTTYVNPGWKDGGPPALSAAELNAISDTLAANQAKIASLQTSVAGKGQNAFGSYVGTGLYGESNPNTITVPFEPKMLWIYGMKSSEVFIGYNMYQNATVNIFAVPCSVLSTSYVAIQAPKYLADYSASYVKNSKTYAKKSSNGKTISWYNDYANGVQLNSSGITYYWIAFG